MRAGLLSSPPVIELINETFVPTWTLTADLEQKAQEEDSLAKTLMSHWEYPVDLIFLSPQGEFINKLNSFRDFPDVHDTVATPPGKFGISGAGPTHSDVFTRHVRRHFQNKEDDVE